MCFLGVRRRGSVGGCMIAVWFHAGDDIGSGRRSVFKPLISRDLFPST